MQDQVPTLRIVRPQDAIEERVAADCLLIVYLLLCCLLVLFLKEAFELLTAPSEAAWLLIFVGVSPGMAVRLASCKRTEPSLFDVVARHDVVDAPQHLVLDLVVILVMLMHEVGPLEPLDNVLEHLHLAEENVEQIASLELRIHAGFLSRSDCLVVSHQLL